MDESNGDSNGKPGTGLVVKQAFKGGEILGVVLRRSTGSQSTELDPNAASALPTEVRRVRRGKFFLSRHEQTTYGSIRKPIFEYWGHGVVVGEMASTEEPEGMWCFGAHNDFDLIPEFMKPSDWPEYTRTPTGWVRKDGARRIEAPSSNTLEKLMEWNLKQLRLK
jgi:hypothetical protein